MIDIKHKQGARHSVTTPAFNLAGKGNAEPAAIGQARKRIQIRVGSQLIDLLAQQVQVFLRLAKGETIGNMAVSMSLSVKTVSTYRTRVMEKMHLESNSDLTYYALKNGLIQ